MSFGMDIEGDAAWSALFLPLKEKVVFASFITMLGPSLVNEGDTETGATRSPLFTLCGERADAIVCVLSDRQVVFFDLTDGNQGPKELHRLRGTSHLHGFRGSVATCASLVPLEIAHMCRISSEAMLSNTFSSSCAGENSLIATTMPAMPDRSIYMYLRGIVGSSDGRVDIFSEHGYVFAFVAHDAPLAAVSVIYLGDGSNENGSGVHLPKNGDSVQTAGGDAKDRTFESSIAGMGFVTCSAEGVVFVWRVMEDLSLKPAHFERSSFLSRTFTYHVVQPSGRECLLSGMGVPQAPMLVHTTPGLGHKLRARSVLNFEDVETPVELPGLPPTRTTALASDGKIALVARGKKVYSVVFPDTQCSLVFTARHTVKGIYIHKNGFAAVTCNQGGLLYVLTLQPLAVCGSYRVRGGGPIRSVSLHPASCLLTIVNGKGAVEVVLMPNEWCGAGEGDTKSSIDVMESIQAARALHCLVDVQQQGTRTPTASPKDNSRPVAHESLLLARIAVPRETGHYLRRAVG